MKLEKVPSRTALSVRTDDVNYFVPSRLIKMAKIPHGLNGHHICEFDFHEEVIKGSLEGICQFTQQGNLHDQSPQV